MPRRVSQAPKPYTEKNLTCLLKSHLSRKVAPAAAAATAAAAAAAPAAAAAANVAAGTTLLQKAYENFGFLTPKRNATARFTSSETIHRKVPNVPSEIPCHGALK